MSVWEHQHLSTREFRHVTKSSSAAGCTRRWLDNTSTCTHVWIYACVAKSMSNASCSWWWHCYMSKRTCGQVLVWPSRCLMRLAAENDFVIHQNARLAGAFVAKSMSSAFCSWWWLCYMSKRTCWQMLVLPSRCLVGPAADDHFFMSRNHVCTDAWVAKSVSSASSSWWWLCSSLKYFVVNLPLITQDSGFFSKTFIKFIKSWLNHTIQRQKLKERWLEESNVFRISTVTNKPYSCTSCMIYKTSGISRPLWLINLSFT